MQHPPNRETAQQGVHSFDILTAAIPEGRCAVSLMRGKPVAVSLPFTESELLAGDIERSQHKAERFHRGNDWRADALDLQAGRDWVSGY